MYSRDRRSLCSAPLMELPPLFSHVRNRLTEEATNGDASPPNVKTMGLITRQAFEIDEYLRIADILRRRFAGFDRRQWREGYKALLLLDHLLTHGPRSAALEFQKDTDAIQKMTTFQCIDEKG
jgi:epsin